jgi:hypothetical protein
LEKLREKDLPVKLSKCEFHKHRIAFLGYIVSENGLAPDPEKIKAIEEWPEPTDVKDVQAFLGLANYYRKFVGHYSGIAGALTELTKKDKKFDFDGDCIKAFNELKRRLTSAPILTIFDPEFESLLETDASDGAIAACLKQKGTDGKMRVIAYYSRKMTGPELNYDIHDKELLAVVEALRHWRVYLEGSEIPNTGIHRPQESPLLDDDKTTKPTTSTMVRNIGVLRHTDQSCQRERQCYS